MAFESYYWKKDIKRDISYIKKWMELKISDLSDEKGDEYISKIEIKLFLMAFSIRKLLDTRRLPDSVLEMKIKVKKFRRNSKRRGLFTSFERLYDLDTPIDDTLKVRFVLNQFIHAYYFDAISNRNGKIRYIFTTSDDEMKNFIYLIELSRFVKLIDRITRKQVKSISNRYDASSGRIITTVN